MQDVVMFYVMGYIQCCRVHTFTQIQDINTIMAVSTVLQQSRNFGVQNICGSIVFHLRRVELMNANYVDLHDLITSLQTGLHTGKVKQRSMKICLIYSQYIYLPLAIQISMIVCNVM